MASSVHRLLTLEDETLVGIARAGPLVNDPFKRKIPQLLTIRAVRVKLQNGGLALRADQIKDVRDVE